MAVETREIWYGSSNGADEVYAKIWEDKSVKPEFILQIAHGMCEYVERYDDFAKFICANGGIVCGNDHTGHGHTGEKSGLMGYFADKDGDMVAVQDIHKLTELIKAEHPELPLILLGHSMGSFLARTYNTLYPQDTAGAIYMGTGGKNPMTGILKLITRLQIIFGQAKKESKLLTDVGFAKYNDRYDDVRSKNDWLTRDRDIVAKYDADPWCTYRFTNRAANDMAKIMSATYGTKWAARLPKELPYLVVSGDMDPVGEYGAGVKQVYGWMVDAGVKRADLKLYPGARHEILNEVNKAEVYADILDWIKGTLV